MGPRLSNVGTNATDGVAAACSSRFLPRRKRAGFVQGGAPTDTLPIRTVRFAAKRARSENTSITGPACTAWGGKYMTAEGCRKTRIAALTNAKPCGVGLSSNANRTACVSCEAGRFREWNKSAETCDTCYPATIAPEDETVCQKPLNLGSTSYVYNCDGSCRNDADGDGICDLYETISLGWVHKTLRVAISTRSPQ